MVGIAHARITDGRPALFGLVLVLAVALGIAVALAPVPALGGAVLLTLVAGVAVRPVFGAYLLVGASLLLAGIERGVAIPLVRPHEAVVVLVLAGLALHGLLAARFGVRPRLALRFDRLDVAILALAVTSSIVPLAWMLIRERPIEQDDLLFALQLWKLYAVFVVVRLSVRSSEQVMRCLWVLIGAGALVALAGIAQALGAPGVQDLIVRFYTPTSSAEDYASHRATSTLGSSFAVADVMVYCLAIAAGLLVQRIARRGAVTALATLFVFGTLASGQFSAVIGILVAVLAFGIITRRLGRSLVALSIAGILAATALYPVVDQRLRSFDTASGLPRSWQGRLDNLDRFFLPTLGADFNWATGVRPAARESAPGRPFIAIESGHVWLLWTGGVALALAFVVFLAVSLPAVARVARERDGPISVAAIASFTSLGVVAVLMVLDAHLTLRGAAEMSFALLALALVRPLGEPLRHDHLTGPSP